MFELPEYITLAKQLNKTVLGKMVRRGQLGNSPHKFVWYNRTPEEFENLTRGKQVGEAHLKGRWLFIPMQPGYVLLLGECGGRILFHSAGSEVPQKYHLLLTFEDNSFLTVMTQMWGAMELYEQGTEFERPYVKDMRTTPVDPDFTFAYFDGLIEALGTGKKRSVKGLLTQEQLVPGLGNAIAQDILFQARLNPRHPIDELSSEQRRALYDAIRDTLAHVISKGGRYDEVDLFGKPGGYVRLMDSKALACPCPRCGGIVTKMQYLGGATYYCPNCQR